MGVKGEKQKRRPKIKDSKQSEQFKKAARELGADGDFDIGNIIKALAAEKGPKFEIYLHKIYNGNGMIKPIGTPFPSDLVETEWKKKFLVPSPHKGAERDLADKGYHLYEADLSDDLGSDGPASGGKH